MFTNCNSNELPIDLFHGCRRHCVAWQNPRNPHMRIGWLVNENHFVTTLPFRNCHLIFFYLELEVILLKVVAVGTSTLSKLFMIDVASNIILLMGISDLKSHQSGLDNDCWSPTFPI
jgi:hypothetical protein